MTARDTPSPARALHVEPGIERTAHAALPDEALDALVSVLDEVRLGRSSSRPELVAHTGLGRAIVAQRVGEPALPAAYEQVDVAREAIEELSTEHASGAVATRGGEVVGYLIGSVGENEWWRRHVWVGLAGHAAAEPEVVRDLYGAAAERWVGFHRFV